MNEAPSETRTHSWRFVSLACLTITPPKCPGLIGLSNWLSFLLRCFIRLYEWGTQWDSKSLVKVCLSSLLNHNTTKVELWGIWNTPSSPLIPGPFWHGVVTLDSVISMVKINTTHFKTLLKMAKMPHSLKHYTHFLLRCFIRLCEWGTQWDSKSLVKFCLSSLLNHYTTWGARF